MAFSRDEHLQKVAENATFLASIDQSVPGAVGWSITVLFYGALHYVEAYFCSRAKGYNNHYSRATAIQQDSVIKSVYADYRDLENLSREARYDVSAFNAGDIRLARRAYETIECSIKAVIL